MGVLLADPDVDVLNGIDGMTVAAELKCIACGGTMHWKQKGVIKSVKIIPG